ncbi:MAG: hypothetical protein ACXVCP_19565 [Bdellovibrio sp.]
MKNLFAIMVIALSLPAFGSEVNYLCSTLSAPHAAFDNINVSINGELGKINVVTYGSGFTLSESESGNQSTCPVRVNKSDYSITLTDKSITGLLVLNFPIAAFNAVETFQISETYDYDADGTHCTSSVLTCVKQ